MTQTRLVGFEAAALRHADSLTDEQLAEHLRNLVTTVAANLNGQPPASTLRMLAAVALVSSRRLEAK